MSETLPGSRENLRQSFDYPGAGKIVVELLARPVQPAVARGPQPTPPVPFPTEAKPTPPDYTGYPDVDPPDQEYLQE